MSEPDNRAWFERLVDRTPEERLRLLEHADLSETQREMLTAMLAADDSSLPSVFARPAHEWAAQLDTGNSDAQSFLGQSIGPYRIEALLGQGGSAAVFQAVRTLAESSQIVALKILQKGLFSIEARRRFRREQRILAQLSHPNVARLIDGGISDAGIPYIAMELVEGQPLDAYVASARPGMTACLHLAAKLCRAVEAAHRALIVHRDLKPANVMVSETGELKVLDFGIARLLGEDEPATETFHLALTPGYAAPEQYGAAVATTAMDIYALGVIVGELVLGVRLGQDASLPADSRVRRRWQRLDSDLKSLLQGALHLDPAQRYGSAGHLADDIDRYLRHEPVLIRGPTPWHRLRKFVTRHRVTVSISASLMLGLSIAVVTALRERVAAIEAAAGAKVELARANAMRDFMFDAFADAEPGPVRSEAATVTDAVQRAAANIQHDRLASPRARTEMLTRLGGVLNAQGKHDEARTLLEWTAADADERLGATDPLALDATRGVAESATLLGDFVAARRTLDEVLAHVPVAESSLRARTLIDSAMLATKEHNLARATREIEDAVAVSRVGNDPSLLQLALDAYGNVLLASSSASKSIVVYKELLQLNLARFGPNHAAVAATQSALARAQRRAGDLVHGEANARAAVAIDRALYTHPDWHLARHLNALSAILSAKRDYTSALELEREALGINRAVLGDEHPETANSLNNVAMYYVLMEDFSSALVPIRQSLERTVKRYGPEHWESAVTRATYGVVLAKTGAIAAGEAEIDHAIVSLGAVDEPDGDAIATAAEKRVRVALDHDELEAAFRHVDRIQRALESTPEVDSYWTGRVNLLRGSAMVHAGRWAEARHELQDSLIAIGNEKHPNPALLAEARLMLVWALRELHIPHDRELHSALDALDALPNPPSSLTHLASTLAKAESQPLQSNRRQ